MCRIFCSLPTLLFLFTSSVFGSSLPETCPAGAPIGKLDLRAFLVGERGDLSLRTINQLGEGNRIVYNPLLRNNEKRPGEVSLVLAPAAPASPEERLIVFDPKPAAREAEWTVPRKVSVVAFVYGPDGLNKTKVKDFLSQDSELITQLAEYAEKTAQVEGLIQALSNPQTPTENVDAALSGFASQYGWNTRIDHTLPSQQQALAVLQTVSPTLDGYDPLSSQTSQRLGMTARLATSIAGLFLGSPVGLAAGGTAVMLDLKGIAFPKASFRSSFAANLSGDSFTLCGRRDPVPPHTKVGYIWALRIPNVKPPHLTIANGNYLPASLKSPLPVSASDTDWKYMDRARRWRLVDRTGKATEIPVTKSATEKVLEVNLASVSLSPGEYQLAADWDWEKFAATGHVVIERLPNFARVHLKPQSQDHLMAGSGKVPVTLEADDFQFVTKVEIKKEHDEFATFSSVPFVLHSALRSGPQTYMDALLDTTNLQPGIYDLSLTQTDGKAHSVPIEVLPQLPTVTNLPIVMSYGETNRCLTLRGERLELLTQLRSPGAKIQLGPAIPGETERSVTVAMNAPLPAGTTYDAKALVRGHSEPVTLPNAIRIVGPHPQILDAKLSPPADMDIELRPNEFPTGVFVSTLLHVRNVEQDSAVEVHCDGQKAPPMTIYMGDHSATTSLQQIDPEHIFVAFDSSGWPNGCQMVAVVSNGVDGRSDSYALGRLVQMPRIDEFKIVDRRASSDLFEAVIRGTDLQAIERVGWEPSEGNLVTDLPSPVPGQGLKQVLRVHLPKPRPSFHAPIYIWLRGEQIGRATSIHE